MTGRGLSTGNVGVGAPSGSSPGAFCQLNSEPGGSGFLAPLPPPKDILGCI